MGWIFALIAGLVLSWTVGQVLLSRRRPELGLRDGSLRPCGSRPNCVCSQTTSTGTHAISPLTFEGDAAVAFRNLKQVVASQPGMELVAETNVYLRFECTTPLMRYVDDLEFALDTSQNVIHVRSASRVGYSDLGTNGKRVESIREKFTAVLSGAPLEGGVP